MAATALLLATAAHAQTLLQWNGNLNSNWDLNSTPNWLLGTTPTVYTNGAAAWFNDAAVSTAVTLAATVQPASVTVSNSTRNYTFSGPGALNWGAGFTKQGAGTLKSTVSGTGGLWNLVGGTVLLDGSAGAQSNTVQGELWVGSASVSPASLVLTNSSVTAASWLAVGRGNGSSNYVSTLTLYNSSLLCTNASLGYNNGNPSNWQSPALTLNGNSRLVIGGGTGFNLGESSGSSATVTLNDNSFISCSQRLAFGMASGATGTLLMTGASALTNGGYVSIGAAGAGSATLRNNALWQDLGDFNVADNPGSLGTLYLQDNARLLINTLFVGKSANSTGTVYQAGGTVTRNTGGDWRIGGNVSGGTNQVGVYNLSNGVLNAGGANLQVGAYGTGSFNQSGGTVSVGAWPSIGRFTGAVGALNVSGGIFNQTASANSLIIGESGTGTLNVSGTGLVTCAGGLRLGQNAGAVGTVNLNGGTLKAQQVYRGNSGASASFNFNGGVLQAGPGAALAFLNGLSAATVQAGGALIDTGTNVLTIGQDLLDGGGGLTKLGSGTLTLSGNLYYSGANIVSNGALLVTAPTAFGSSGCTVSGGAAFGVKLASPNAQLTLPALALPAAGAGLSFNFAGFGAQSNAPLAVGALALNGPVVIGIAGFNFAVGQFPLLQYGSRSGSGVFALGSLPAGMTAQLVTNEPNRSIDLVIITAPASLPWQLKQAPVMTEWALQVNPTNVWPEYPRPQMQRSSWLNLNGVWQWQAGTAADPLPTNDLSGTILVPFCMESALSGVMEQHDRAWYQRTFSVPAAWSGQRVLLHFEAVDWECEPFLNGVSLGIHRGGYDPFTFDITPYLTNSGPQKLLVRIYDPTDLAGEPRGKQTLYPGGIMYTSCSGIWQSVWLEPVPASSIGDFHLVPDVDNNRLLVNVTVSGPTNGLSVNAVAFDGTNQIAAATGLPGADFYLAIPAPKLWCPTNPFLYNLQLSLTTNTAPIDSVASYFGMRKISLGSTNGFLKVLLNNQFTFQFGPLDQGFWPDGIYTAPTDLALKSDLESEKALGFNMVRKHIKVEPRRWYYWADKLGILVWQDMPSINSYTSNAQPIDAPEFESELVRMVQNHWNHPSIIMWVVFNESQGQHDTAALVAEVKALDPSRLVNQASGGSYYGAGDILDAHSYPNPSCPASTSQAVVCGEFGGVGLGITNHTWAPGWGYVGATDGTNLTSQFEAFCSLLSGFINDNGLSAAVYTQITDVETELNGLNTYDRKVLKPDLLRMQTAVLSLRAQFSNVVVVPTSQTTAQNWKYTFSAPAANWYGTNFNDAAWTNGLGGFGTAGTPGAVIGTTWNTADIWLRRPFDATGLTAQQISNLVFNVHHDESVEIYLNGVLAASATGYTTAYGQLPVNAAALAALLPGPNNLLAVHCHQTGGGQFIDVGLNSRTLLVPPPAPFVPSWPENGVGLRGEYFNGTNFDSPAFVRLDPNLNFNWGGAAPGAGLSGNQFSVRWSGQIQPRYSEGYTFHLTAADGCRLWVDNQLLIDKWRDDAGTDLTGSIALLGGQRYDLRIEYYHHTNSASVALEWHSVSQARELVPQGVLFQNATVLPPVAPSLSAPLLVDGVFQFTVSGDAGPDYLVYCSSNLANWTLLLTTNPPALPFSFRDPFATNSSQRYYRLQLGP